MNKIIVTVTAAALIGGAVTLAAPASAIDAPQQFTRHFAFSAGEQDWTVPAAVSTVTITAAGGAGGHGDDQTYSGGAGANGGRGALVTETIAVKPGDMVKIYPGGAGGGPFDRGVASWVDSPGGYGSLTNANTDETLGGGAGGSATDVTVNGKLVVVAGGGGGGGGGGAFGSDTGGQGGDGGHDGQGGSGWAAGSGGSGWLVGNDANEFGQNSDVDAPNPSAAGGGGGGGAGWDGTTYAGGHAGFAGSNGGGGGGGGAGGASYSSVKGAAVTVAPAISDGYVDLAWTQGITTATGLMTTATPVASGQLDGLTATVTPTQTAGQPAVTGTVTFIDSAPFATTPTTLGSVPVAADGTAHWYAKDFVPGTHGFRAVYSGDANYVSSATGFVYQTIGAPLAASFSVNPVAFGSTVVNTTRTQTVTMTNTNAVPLAILFLSSANGNATSTGGTCFASASLAPGASCTWIVSYTPHTLGENDDTITFAVGDTGSPTLQVTGSGVAAPAPPVVTAVSPRTGRAAGGTLVTVTGRNLAPVTKVAAGGVRLTSVHCTSTTCTGRTPAGHGTVDVRVTTAGGTSASVTADRFSYKA